MHKTQPRPQASLSPWNTSFVFETSEIYQAVTGNTGNGVGAALSVSSRLASPVTFERKSLRPRPMSTHARRMRKAKWDCHHGQHSPNQDPASSSSTSRAITKKRRKTMSTYPSLQASSILCDDHNKGFEVGDLWTLPPDVSDDDDMPPTCLPVQARPCRASGKLKNYTEISKQKVEAPADLEKLFSFVHDASIARGRSCMEDLSDLEEPSSHADTAGIVNLVQTLRATNQILDVDIPAPRPFQRSAVRPTVQHSTVSHFHHFMRLPRELREHVYEEILVSDKAILPRLCSSLLDTIKFHDDNQTAHDAMSQRLAITQVSKQIQEESLPIFYKNNIFTYGQDTLTYLEHLSHLGRFHMIHHVTFPIYFFADKMATRALHDIHKVTLDQEDYERKKKNTECRGYMKAHPFHNAGGFQWIAIFLILRKLSAQFKVDHKAQTTSSKAVGAPENILAPARAPGTLLDYERELVLHIPTETMFDLYPNLKWFRKVIEGLDIKLKFVEGADVKWMHGYSGFYFAWEQKYQKRNAADTPAATIVNQRRKIMEEATEMYPTSNEMPGPNSTAYYRRSCQTHGLGAKEPQIEWFKMTYN